MSNTRDNISNIQSEVIEVVSSLVDSFHSQSANEDQCEAHARALASYVKHVTKIGMTASVVGFKGFRDICVMFQDVLRNMHAANRVLTREECELLEEWPILVMSYLSSPSDQSIRIGIIEHIRKLNKEKDVAEAEYDELLTSLSDIRLSDEDLRKLEQLDLSANQDSSKKELIVSSDGDQSDEIYQESPLIDQETINAIRDELNEILLDLEEPFLSTADINQEEFQYILEYCSDRIGILALSVGETELTGLMDVFLLIQQGLKDIRLNDAGSDFITQFKMLVNSISNYLDDPYSPKTQQELIASLQISFWAVLDDESAKDMLLMFLTPITNDTVDNDVDVNTTSEQVDDEPDIDDEEPTIDDLEEISVYPEAHEPVEQEIQHDTYNENNAAAESEIIETDLLSQEVDFEENSLQEESETSRNKIDTAIQELIDLILIDIEFNKDTISACVTNLQVSDDIAVRNDSLLDYTNLLTRFSTASASIGWLALAEVFDAIKHNVELIEERNQIVTSAYAGLLCDWQEHVITYMKDISSESCVNELIAFLCDENWIQPFEPDAAIELGLSLLSSEFSFEDDESEPREDTATSEAVSLQLPEDVNSQLLETLLGELPHYTEEFSHAVNRLTDGQGTITDVEVAQRVAHTLKGSANTVGITGIATLTHHIEDILIAYSSHEKLPGTTHSEILLRAADTLEVMSESLLGLGAPPNDALEVLQLVLDLANYIDSNGIPDDDLVVGNSNTAGAQPVQESARNDGEESSNSQFQQESAENILRVPAPLIDELLRLSGETVIVNSQLQEQLRHIVQQNHVAQQQNKLLQQLTFELEQLVDVQGFTSQESGLQNEDFDSLEMDKYNELHTVTRRLVEAATDTQEISFSIENELDTIETLLVAQSRQNKTNQNIVMQTRMVPVKTIVPRLNRSVRQTARLTDKKVTLDVQGEDTLVDSEVLNNLLDPLMHILRNAVDHGLENESTRLAAGKDTCGNINLTFKREGDQFIVVCSDDGAGLDYAAIRQIAVERGLIDTAEAISEDELQRLILKQGFSTREKVTQVSGRGIGMDAVYNKVLTMKGMLNIASQSGQGCRFELRLPITFISEHALLIKMRGQQIAISSRGVEQILYPGAGRIFNDESGLYYESADDTTKASYLDVILNLGRDRREPSRQSQPILQVRQDSGELHAVVIDEVVASQELVIKPLGQYVPKINGIDGATILGDGSVAPVIDLPELLRSQTGNYSNITVIDTESHDDKSRLCALVVDDSLSARRALAEFVEDVGYEVRTARDGLEAIDVLAERIPDIVLVDLEMPRMNGLEFSQHIRAQQETTNIPIIMITSRSTEKHRHQAESAGVNVYLTKPFSEDSLLRHIEDELKIVSDKVAV